MRKKKDTLEKARDRLRDIQEKAIQQKAQKTIVRKTYRVKRDSDGSIVASGVPYKFAHDIFWRYAGSADVIDETTGAKVPFEVLESDLSPEEFGY